MIAMKSLQISTQTANAPLTPEQQRFNFLIAQISKVRKAYADSESSLQTFRQNRSQRLLPLRESLKKLCRETVLAIDRLLDQPGWSRPARAALRQILCATADALLEANNEDTQIREFFDKHSEADFDTAKQDELQRLKAELEESTGVKLGDDAEIRSEEDLVQRMYEEMAAREAAESDRQEEKAQRQRKSAAQKRSEDNAELARQSLRDIYRKLASAVHPDREQDPERREAKNILMQKINQAYAANDLLTLFEAQMQIEQIDAGQISKMSAERLKQYNKLLAEQLSALQATRREIETAFCMDHDLQVGVELTQQTLARLLQQQAKSLRAEIAQQQQFLEMLADKAATRRWLAQQRRFARSYEDDDEDDE